MDLLEKNKTFQEMEKILKVFHQGMLQDFFTFLDILSRKNITLRDVKRYVRQVKENNRLRVEAETGLRKRSRAAIKEQERWKKLVKHCPLCNSPLSLDKVTAPKGNANVYGYRGVWRCLGEECLFEEFMKEYPEAIYDQLMGR